MNRIRDYCPNGRQLVLAVEEGLLLLLAGFTFALVGAGRYHPSFAGEPFRALPFWQQGLCLALILGLVEIALVTCGKRRLGLSYPLGVTEVRSWFQRD